MSPWGRNHSLWTHLPKGSPVRSSRDRGEEVNLELIFQNHLSFGWKNDNGQLFILLILIDIRPQCSWPLWATVSFLLPFPSSATSSPSLLWWSLSQEVAPPSTVMLRLEAWMSTLFPVWSARPPERSQMQIHLSLLFACSTFRFGLISLFSRFTNVLRLLHLPEATFLTHLLMLPGALQGRVGSFSQGGFYQLPLSVWVLEAVWSILSPGMFSSHGIPVKTLEMHSVSNSVLYTENWFLLKLCK